MTRNIDDRLDQLAAENAKNEALYPELANTSIDYSLYQELGHFVLSMNLSARSQEVETDNYLSMVLDLVLGQGPLYLRLAKTFSGATELSARYQMILNPSIDLSGKEPIYLEGIASESEEWHEIINLLSYKFSSEDLLLMGLPPHLVDNDLPNERDYGDDGDFDDWGDNDI